jgi:DNA-binding NarL/FixJ family response regulator
MPPRTRVLIVDDHPIFRAGLCRIIDADESLEIVGEADCAERALEMLEAGSIPDVAVVDIDMPGINGLQLTELLQHRDPPLPVVLLTMHKNENLFNEAIDLGVSAYLLKDEAVTGVVEGIQQAAKGQSYVSPTLANFVMRRSQQSAVFNREATGLQLLTPTERKVLKLVAENKSSKEIGAELFISPRTVGAHRNNICGKLGLKGKHPLLNFALANRSQIHDLPD